MKLLECAVGAACCSTEGVFKCSIAHRRSVAVLLCLLYKIRCNQMHPLYGALPGPYVPARVTPGALLAYRCTYEPPHCRTSQYRRTLFPSQFVSRTILLTLYSSVWDWRVSRASQLPFHWPSCSPNFCIIPFSLSLLYLYGVGIARQGSSD